MIEEYIIKEEGVYKKITTDKGSVCKTYLGPEKELKLIESGDSVKAEYVDYLGRPVKTTDKVKFYINGVAQSTLSDSLSIATVEQKDAVIMAEIEGVTSEIKINKELPETLETRLTRLESKIDTLLSSFSSPTK
jgi:hypothetical protein